MYTSKYLCIYTHLFSLAYGACSDLPVVWRCVGRFFHLSGATKVDSMEDSEWMDSHGLNQGLRGSPMRLESVGLESLHSLHALHSPKTSPVTSPVTLPGVLGALGVPSDVAVVEEC